MVWVYPGQKGMVDFVLVFLMVVYLSTNQGGVFEYGTLVSVIGLLDDHMGHLAQVNMV